MVHIIGGEWGWLQYWMQPSHTPESLKDLWTRHDDLFNPDAFPDLSKLQLKWAEVEKEQAGFVNRVTDEDLERLLPFRSTRISLALLMQHLVNHSTYHRGQIAILLQQLNAKSPATDLHVFLQETRSV